eukprot:2747822-Rhodomonas_salina.2
MIGMTLLVVAGGPMQHIWGISDILDESGANIHHMYLTAAVSVSLIPMFIQEDYGNFILAMGGFWGGCSLVLLARKGGMFAYLHAGFHLMLGVFAYGISAAAAIAPDPL